MDNNNISRINRLISKYLDSTTSLPREIRITVTVYLFKALLYYYSDKYHQEVPVEDVTSHGAIDEIVSNVDEYLLHLLPEQLRQNKMNNKEKSKENNKDEESSVLEGNIIEMENEDKVKKNKDSFEDMVYDKEVPKHLNQHWAPSLNNISLSDSSSEE